MFRKGDSGQIEGECEFVATGSSPAEHSSPTSADRAAAQKAPARNFFTSNDPRESEFRMVRLPAVERHRQECLCHATSVDIGTADCGIATILCDFAMIPSDIGTTGCGIESLFCGIATFSCGIAKILCDIAIAGCGIAIISGGIATNHGSVETIRFRYRKRRLRYRNH
jgi:hypothetical protein